MLKAGPGQTRFGGQRFTRWTFCGCGPPVVRAAARRVKKCDQTPWGGGWRSPHEFYALQYFIPLGGGRRREERGQPAHGAKLPRRAYANYCERATAIMAAPFFRLDASPRAPARGEDSVRPQRKHGAVGAGY